MKISIIMPVYNGENYLKKSISRVIEQGYKNIELILVNDGSIDDSKSICESFANKDPRVILINKRNGGICSARNTGLKNASGEIISFVDQDDEILPNMYTDMINAFYDEDIDLVVSGKVMYLIDKNNILLREVEYNYTNLEISDIETKIKYLLNVNRDMALLHLWNCLYRKSLIDKEQIWFDEHFRFGHEDSLFNIEYGSKCKKIKILSGIVYKYFRRVSVSTSLKYNNKYLNDYYYFTDKASKAINIDSSKSIINKIFLTFAIRLGINLFRQYDSCKNNETIKNDLKSIFEIACRSSKISDISCEGVRGRIYYVYLYVVFHLLKKGNYSIAAKIILFKNSDK